MCADQLTSIRYCVQETCNCSPRASNQLQARDRLPASLTYTLFVRSRHALRLSHLRQRDFALQPRPAIPNPRKPSTIAHSCSFVRHSTTSTVLRDAQTTDCPAPLPMPRPRAPCLAHVRLLCPCASAIRRPLEEPVRTRARRTLLPVSTDRAGGQRPHRPPPSTAQAPQAQHPHGDEPRCAA